MRSMGREKDDLIDKGERERMYAEKCSVCGEPVDALRRQETMRHVCQVVGTLTSRGAASRASPHHLVHQGFPLWVAASHFLPTDAE